MSKPLVPDSTSCNATISAFNSASTCTMRLGTQRPSRPTPPCMLYDASLIARAFKSRGVAGAESPCSCTQNSLKFEERGGGLFGRLASEYADRDRKCKADAGAVPGNVSRGSGDAA